MRPVREVRIDLSTQVNASAADVYAFLADIQDAEPIPRRASVRMVKHPPGPTALGTTWKEAVKFAPGLWMHIDSVVTDAQPPHVLAMRFVSRWWSGTLRYDITDTADGCRLRHREALRPCRPLRPLTHWMESRLIRTIEQRLHDIATAMGDRPTSRCGSAAGG